MNRVTAGEGVLAGAAPGKNRPCRAAWRLRKKRREPPLPLVNQDLQRMARKAVEFLMQRLGGDDSPPRMVLLDPELIVMS